MHPAAVAILKSDGFHANSHILEHDSRLHCAQSTLPGVARDDEVQAASAYISIFSQSPIEVEWPMADCQFDA